MGKKNCFEITGQKEYFSEELKDALIDWCDSNHYEYAWIEHDKDTKYDDETNEEVLKVSHYHFMVCTGSVSWAFKIILERFSRYGLLSTMLQKVRKGWNNALSYLVHRTDGAVNDGKHLYDLSEVHANFDYVKTVEVIEEQVEEKKSRIDEVIEAINTLKCRRYNIFEYISIEDYTKKGNKLKIDMAFQYVETRLRAEKKDRDMKVYWIYGKPGIGKTTLAKFICSNEKWSYAVSSSSNDPLQDYEGQDALILDDFRPSNWTKSDVLKMLDNNTISSIKSRYQNKQTCYLRGIIITTVQSPYELWLNGWEGGSKEPYDQLSRRITFKVEMYKDENDGDFAHTYFNVVSYNKEHESVTRKYDFTSELIRIRQEVEKELNESFKGMTCVETAPGSIDLKKSNVNVDDSDVPPF